MDCKMTCKNSLEYPIQLGGINMWHTVRVAIFNWAFLSNGSEYECHNFNLKMGDRNDDDYKKCDPILIFCANLQALN